MSYGSRRPRVAAAARHRTCPVTPPRPVAAPVALVALVALGTLASSAPALAEDPTDVLDTLVVTGTRGERRLLDVPVRTEVVTREEIERTHARDAAEALDNQPGVLLQRIHGKDGTEVWLQGLDSDRVLVLLDGRPLSASTGSTVDLSQIGSVDIERIEIVKGAVSALYGSAAMGGVVNIITRTPEAPLAASLSFDAGSFGPSRTESDSVAGERRLAARGAVRQGALDVTLNADVRNGDGYDLDPDTYDSEGPSGTRADLSTQIGLDLGKRDRLTARSAWYSSDGERDFSTFAPGVGDIEKLDVEEVSRLTQTLDWRRDLGGGEKLAAWAAFERFENRTVQDIVASGRTDRRRDAEIVTARMDLQYDRPLGDAQILSAGASLSDESLEQALRRDESGTPSRSDEIDPGSDRQGIEAFVQNDIFIGDAWELLPGVRVQDDSDFGTHVAPKINLLYTPAWQPEWAPRLRAGIGSGYRVPNLKERHFLFDHGSLGYVVIGNEALEPEQSLSLQFGLEVSRNQRTRAEVSLFHNRIDGLIASTRDAAATEEQGIEVFRYANVDEARTRGLETSVQHAFGPRFSVDAAWTWLDATDRRSDLRLTRRPRHQIQLGTDLLLGRTGVALRASWQGASWVDAGNTIESPAWASLQLKLDRAIGRSVSGCRCSAASTTSPTSTATRNAPGRISGPSVDGSSTQACATSAECRPVLPPNPFPAPLEPKTDEISHHDATPPAPSGAPVRVAGRRAPSSAPPAPAADHREPGEANGIRNLPDPPREAPSEPITRLDEPPLRVPVVTPVESPPEAPAPGCC